MDATDEITITNKFNKLEENERNIIKNINQQNIINNDIAIRFKNITDHINMEQENINLFIKNYKNNIFKSLNDEHNEIHLL